MTLDWRHPRAGETDHELLWGLVGMAALVVATAGWAAGAVPTPGCVFKAVTGVPCVTCGSTRALWALAAGDVLRALRLNPLAVASTVAVGIYVPYGACVGLAGARRLRVRLQQGERNWVRGIVLTAIAACWLLLILDGR